jgi:hypothetical protein
MQRRMARLLECDDVEPTAILAVTFTRNAAANLLRDLRALAMTRLDAALANKLGAKMRGPGRHRGMRPTMTSQFIGELGPAKPDAVTGEEWVGAGYSVPI